MTTYAVTPKGHRVEVSIVGEYGSYRLQSGVLFYGGVKVAGWNEGGSSVRCFETALVKADDRIDFTGLSVDGGENV